ncbi:Uncharacterized protein BM_BM17310 [Brugia malayi]|uniref:Uncharacterized protein n=1 Tax=Brugia malayi TaxID=6279 RepID=A0A4E9F1Y3_BRUMA|nr:Uncharacterized protein BM_BM17310 [Brugia malayi]VIO90047.1 Uncharacterized protein BM_BM17310 [Brugia malayi]
MKSALHSLNIDISPRRKQRITKRHVNDLKVMNGRRIDTDGRTDTFPSNN